MSKNFAAAAVTVAPSPATSGTTVGVASGQGARFTLGPAAVRPSSGVADPTNSEVVNITGITGGSPNDTITVTRGYESSTARTVGIGDLLVQGITAGMWDTLTAQADDLETRVEALESAAPSAAFVRITTTGSSFAPVVELAPGSTATVSWSVEGTSLTATGLTPTLNFHTALTRHVRMTVTDGGADALDQLVMLNLGFNHTDDSGTYNMGAQYDHAAQAVSAIENLHLLTGLLRFAAASTTLAGELDFTGCSHLQYIECAFSAVQGVILTGCTSLIRLCLEQANTHYVDLNPVAANLKDFRGALQQGGSGLTVASLTANLAQIYHFCVRDQPVTGIPAASRLPVVEQLWIWNTGQSGTLTVTSSAVTSLQAYSNGYTAVDLTGRTTLTSIDLHANSLDRGAVDAVLVEVNSWATSNGYLDLSGAGNAAPSATGLTARTALLARGWTVLVAGGGALWSDDFGRADATGLANVGNGWVALNGGDADITSGDLVRTDTGAYRGVMNPAGSGIASSDYTVTVTLAGPAKNGGFLGVAGRWDGGNGVAAFWNSNTTAITELYIAEAAGYMVNSVLVTPDSSIPASWLSNGVDSTMAVEFLGATVNVHLDGILVGHATFALNSSTTHTGVGMVGEGQARHMRSIAVT